MDDIKTLYPYNKSINIKNYTKIELVNVENEDKLEELKKKNTIFYYRYPKKNMFPDTIYYNFKQGIFKLLGNYKNKRIQNVNYSEPISNSTYKSINYNETLLVFSEGDYGGEISKNRGRRSNWLTFYSLDEMINEIYYDPNVIEQQNHNELKGGSRKKLSQHKSKNKFNKSKLRIKKSLKIKRKHKL